MYANIINLELSNPVTEFVKNHTLFKYINLYSWKEYDLINKEIPTLYIGYRRCQSVFNSIDIGNNNISATENWTFTPEESLIHFIEQITDFLKNIPYILIKNIKVKSLEPFFTKSLKTESDVTTAIQEFKPKLCYYHDKVFTFSNGSKNILLLNSNIWQAFNLTKEMVFEFINQNNNIQLFDDTDEKIRFFFINKFEYNASDTNVYAPYLIYLKHKRT